MDQIPNVKFFITDRSVPQVLCGFWLTSLSRVTEVFRLREVNSLTFRGGADIKLFLIVRLMEIINTRRDCILSEPLPERWPDWHAIPLLQSPEVFHVCIDIHQAYHGLPLLPYPEARCHPRAPAESY